MDTPIHVVNPLKDAVISAVPGAMPVIRPAATLTTCGFELLHSAAAVTSCELPGPTSHHNCTCAVPPLMLGPVVKGIRTRGYVGCGDATDARIEAVNPW